MLPSWQLASSGEATSKDEVKSNSVVTLTTEPAPESIIISTKEACDNQQLDAEKKNEVRYMNLSRQETFEMIASIWKYLRKNENSVYFKNSCINQGIFA